MLFSKRTLTFDDLEYLSFDNLEKEDVLDELIGLFKRYIHLNADILERASM